MQSVLEVFWEIILALLGAVAFAGLTAAGIFLGVSAVLLFTGKAVYKRLRRRKP